MTGSPGVCNWRYDAKNSATEKSAVSIHSNPAPNVVVLPAQAILSTTLSA